MRGPKGDPEKEKHWRSLLGKFHLSGLPFRKFCAEEKISPNTFQLWRRILREKDEALGVASKISKGQNKSPEVKAKELKEKIDYWLHVIDDANSNPCSLYEYCRSHNVPSGSLYHWEKRLLKMGLTQGLRHHKEPPVEKKMFAQVSIVEPGVVDENAAAMLEPKILDTNRIEIRSRNGNSIFVPLNTSVDRLLQLANGLRGIDC